MKIAIIRSETPLTVEQQEQARNNVRKQLPADWTVVFLPRLMSADFLEIVACDDPDKINVASSVSYPPNGIVTAPQKERTVDPLMEEMFPGASSFITEPWADRVREATGRGLTVIGRANGAPPKVMNGNYETGKSIGMYAHWIAANPSAQCDHEFVGKMEPGAFLTCLYCHRSRRLPDAKE